MCLIGILLFAPLSGCDEITGVAETVKAYHEVTGQIISLEYQETRFGVPVTILTVKSDKGEEYNVGYGSHEIWFSMGDRVHVKISDDTVANRDIFTQSTDPDGTVHLKTENKKWYAILEFKILSKQSS